MLLPFFLLLVLVVWALIDSEMYAKEAIIHGAVWAVCLAGLFLVPGYGVAFVVPVCLQDIYLLIKLVGNPRAF
ncbi:MAG: hypothetical protein P4L46_24790 [Fimbriimonas sp.]|nr:hypothetical protein [Fimbriimonas sp.]